MYTEGVCNHSFLDANDHRFTIYTAADAGLDQFTVNAQGQGMQRIPEGHTTSIRLGDMRSTGTCVNTYGAMGNNKGSEALFYTLRVTPQDALIFIDYAVVARRYDHSPREAGEFIIRVVGHDSDGRWNNFPLNDSLWYCVPAPHFAGTLAAPWVDGRPGNEMGGTTCSYCYKPWTKVAINLEDYIYDSVRVEMYTSDCIYNVDPIYAYIAGSSQPLVITSTGCPSGATEAVDSLYAPEGMLSYVWYCSNSGPINVYNAEELASATFRRLYPPEGERSESNLYLPTIADFVATSGAHAGDTLTEQTFKCVMTSALDPDKPFESVVYANVYNVKPVVSFNSQVDCDGRVILDNTSFTPHLGETVLVDSLTRWVFYDNPNCTGTPIDTLVGDSVIFQPSERGVYGMQVWAFTNDSTCNSVKNTQIVIPEIPQAVIDVEREGMCKDDSVSLHNQTPDIVSYCWYFADDTVCGDATHDHNTVTRLFPSNVNTVVLSVTNSVGCSDTATVEVAVFFSPELTIVGDTFVCDGTQTDIRVVSATEGCTYQWYYHYDVPGETPFSQGEALRETPGSVENTYYVLVTSPQGCRAWDSVRVHKIATHITITPGNGAICPGDTAVLEASGAYHYLWESDPYDPTLAGQETLAEISVSPSSTTTYSLVGYGPNECVVAPEQQMVTVVPYPVLDVRLTPSYIDEEEPIVVFTDLSEYGYRTSWLVNGVPTFQGSPVTYRFDDLYDSVVHITMQSFNIVGCMSDTTFTIPVNHFGIWVPNVFAPGMEDNGEFALHTINELEDFTIYFYDRRGDLVFSSTNPHFSWDGTHDGNPCTQDAYVYIYRYRRVGRTDYHYQKGSVLLLR